MPILESITAFVGGVIGSAATWTTAQVNALDWETE